MRQFFVVFLIFVLSLSGAMAILGGSISTASSPATSNSYSWRSATPYPLLSSGSKGVESEACVSYSGYLYCVGGSGKNFDPVPDVNYAKLTKHHYALNWKSTTSYPTLSTGNPGILGEACVAESGYIFCLGGYDANYNLVPDSYYATLSGHGVGTWSSTTSYPLSVESPSCAASFGYIYCVGGYEGGGTFTSNAYYATISSSGIGAWTPTTSYPTLSTGNSGIAGQSCVIWQGYIYCIAGEDNQYNSVPDVYYATVSDLGIGTWTATTPYPVAQNGGSCAILVGHVYCVGGYKVSRDTKAAYAATLTSSGISSWRAIDSYPVAVDSQSCVASSSFSYVYCIGGVAANQKTVIPNVYYLPV
jgi:hypothetical protein